MEQPAVTIKDWRLQLKKSDGSVWEAYEWRSSAVTFKRSGWALGKAHEEETVTFSFRERTSTVPMDVGAAEEGWAMFRVAHPTMCHLFGTTFVLTATDDLDGTSECIKAPGEWLAPMEFVQFS
jgi:hypothetical protein